MLSRINKFLNLFRILFRYENISIFGGTSSFADAKHVFSRYRKGEPILNGPHIGEFEKKLSEYYGGLQVATFGAGRMALFAILKAMDMENEDEIILPGYTCIVTPAAIKHAGLKPVYVDVSKQDFNIIPELIKKAVTPRTRAIVAQHTFGIPCNMDSILDLSKKYGLLVIEDGAHAIGARWNDCLLGNFGDAAFFSTQSTKMFSTEHGGFSVTKDPDLAERIRTIQKEAKFSSEYYERCCLLRWCYRAAFYGKPKLNPRLSFFEVFLRRLRIPGIHSVLDYDLKEYKDALTGLVSEPYPSRLPNLMAYAGLLQLQRLEEDLAHRRRLAAYLEEQLPKLGAAVANYPHNFAKPSWIRFPFVVKDRTKWIIAMKQNGIFQGTWLNDPIHPKGSLWEKVDYVRGMCPNAEYLSEHILNIPVDRRMSIERINKFLKTCRKLNVCKG